MLLFLSATQFRQWATQRLKDHLVKGYSLNEKRLQQVAQNMHQLQQAVKLIEQSSKKDITPPMAGPRLNVKKQCIRCVFVPPSAGWDN